jgi:hypothetical protein
MRLGLGRVQMNSFELISKFPLSKIKVGMQPMRMFDLLGHPQEGGVNCLPLAPASATRRRYPIWNCMRFAGLLAKDRSVVALSRSMGVKEDDRHGPRGRGLRPAVRCSIHVLIEGRQLTGNAGGSLEGKARVYLATSKWPSWMST